MKGDPATQALTRAEVYQLAVYWCAQPDSFMARERLYAIGRVLGRRALEDARHDAADAAEFGDDDGYLLEEPWIENPDALCADFAPTVEERRALADLYRLAASRCLDAVAALERIFARWPKAA